MRRYKIDHNKICCSFSLKVYGLESIMKTAYEFLDAYYVFIDREDDTVWVSLESKQPLNIGQHRAAVGEFYNELLNQQIRYTVYQETKTVRELIITRALYSSYIEQEVVPDAADANYLLEDIAKDWFEEKK